MVEGHCVCISALRKIRKEVSLKGMVGRSGRRVRSGVGGLPLLMRASSKRFLISFPRNMKSRSFRSRRSKPWPHQN